MVRGFEEICSSNESKRRGAGAEAGVASHLFHHGRDQAEDWTKQKRGEGDYQAMSVDVLRTFQGVKAG